MRRRWLVAAAATPQAGFASRRDAQAGTPSAALVTIASGQSGVEQHGSRSATPTHGYHRGEAVLGYLPDLGGSRFELRCLCRSGRERGPGDRLVRAEERVVDVVDQGGDHDLIHRRQRDRVMAFLSPGRGVPTRMSSALADRNAMTRS